MKKILLSLGLACMALPLESAALRQIAARTGLAARVGVGVIRQGGVRLVAQHAQLQLKAMPQHLSRTITTTSVLRDCSVDKTVSFSQFRESLGGIPKQIQEKRTLDFLDKHFDKLHVGQVCDLIPYLSLVEGQQEWALRAITTRNTNEHYFLALLSWLAPEERIKQIARLFTETDFIHRCVSPVRCANDDSALALKKVFRYLPDELQKHYVLTFLDKETLPQVNFWFLLSAVSSQDVKEQCIAEYFRAIVPHLTSDQKGPLFSRYFKNISHKFYVDMRYSQHFCRLLPSIKKHVEEQYKKGRIVYFHGQSSAWVLLTDMYQGLRVIKGDKGYGQGFVPLRFTKVSPLTEKDVECLVSNGLSYYDGTRDRAWLLFANLHLFANARGSNTWEYITENYDQSIVSGRLNFDEKLRSLFENEGLLQEFEAVRKDLEKVKKLYDLSVVYPHGHTGRLIVISMPRDVASKISYAARPGGLLKKMHINGKQTSNPVEIADYYDEVEDQNEFCACITTTMLDACKAREAGIVMQTFDLRDFSKTESWQEYQVALKALLDRVKELYEKQQAFKACEAGMGGW